MISRNLATALSGRTKRRCRTPVTAPTTLRDWIPEHALTVILGSQRTGKTSIVEALAKGWDGPSFYFTYDTVPDKDTRRWFKHGVFHCHVTSLEDLIKMVRALVDQSVGKSSLIIIDGFTYLTSKSDGLGASAKMWGQIVRTLCAMESTVVLTGTSSQNLIGSQMPKIIAFYASTILELDEIARHSEGVIVEVIAKKDRRRPPGTRGRLWIRPEHETPVRTT